jgi:hypothetical protein
MSTVTVHLRTAISASHREEIISALWAICALLAFGFDFFVWGCVFTIKAATDLMCSCFNAWKEYQAWKERDDHA